MSSHDSRKERHKTHSEKSNEEGKRDKPEAAIVYNYAYIWERSDCEVQHIFR